jgi:hypothetical protein
MQRAKTVASDILKFRAQRRRVPLIEKHGPFAFLAHTVPLLIGAQHVACKGKHASSSTQVGRTVARLLAMRLAPGNHPEYAKPGMHMPHVLSDAPMCLSTAVGWTRLSLCMQHTINVAPPGGGWGRISLPFQSSIQSKLRAWPAQCVVGHQRLAGASQVRFTANQNGRLRRSLRQRRPIPRHMKASHMTTLPV